MDDELKKNINQYIGGGHFASAKKDLLKDLKIKIDEHKKDLHDHKEETQGNSELYLAHYTSMETIYSILTDAKKDKLHHSKDQSKDKADNSQDTKEENLAFLRLYNVSSLNDPSEGEYLRKELSKEYKWLEDVEIKDTDAFICSFVSGEEEVGNALPYWQAYGDDGLGCSIQLPPNADIFHSVIRILYGNDQIETVKDKFKFYFELGSKLHEKLPKKKEKEDDKKDDKEMTKEDFATEFWESFDKIKFLYKSDAYEHEKEYRYVVFSKDSDKEIKYHFKSEGSYLRRYILEKNLQANNILTTSRTVFIGPRVADKERVCLYLEELAEQAGLPGPEFIASELPYQKLW